MAAVTHESIPPLTRTTALDFSAMLRRSPRIQTPCVGRVPDEFVQLQTETHGQPVGQNPFRKQPRIQPVPCAIGIGKHRRKQDLPHAARQFVLGGEIPGEFVIARGCRSRI